MCSASQIPSPDEQKTLLLFSTPLRLCATAGDLFFCLQTAREFSDDPWIELMFGHLYAGMKRLGGITVKQGNAALAQNLARVDSGIDQMNSAPSLRNTGLDGLTPCLQPTEGGKE